MAPLLTIAGVGTSMVFPIVANEVVASVAPHQTGIASGTNNALRELGGVFGVAVLASVFTRPSVYSSPDTFVAGFRSALWIAVAFSAVGSVVEHHDGTVTVTVGSQTAFFDPPTQKDIDTQAVVDLRRMLSAAGYRPEDRGH